MKNLDDLRKVQKIRFKISCTFWKNADYSNNLQDLYISSISGNVSELSSVKNSIFIKHKKQYV